jgi:uncharacterized protein
MNLKRQFKINWWGHHGVRHWARVRSNARLIAQHVPGVDVAVTDWFAVLHDAGRRNEYDDPEHGWRDMAYVRKLHRDNGMLGLNGRQFYQLLMALEHHSHPAEPMSITVAACWNADRLDLGRVGITPRLDLMHPEALPPKAVWWAMHQRAINEQTKQRKLHATHLLPA